MIDARGDLDDRNSRWQNRQTAMLARTRPGPAGARRTPGRALGRCAAIYTKPSYSPLDVALAASRILRLFSLAFGRAPGAPVAIRGITGRGCAAARARARVPRRPVAPPAPVTRERAAPFRVSAAVKNAGRLGPSAPCALGLATLFAAVPAQGPIGRGLHLSAPRTHAAGEALGGNAFITPTPACTFFPGIPVGHVPSLRGCDPGKRRPAGEARPDVPWNCRSAILRVHEQAHRSITPILNAEGGAVDARADDDLAALGPHPLDGAQGGDLAGSLAPALLRRPVAAAGADLAVGFRLEPLDKVAVVIEARAEQVSEESVGAAAKRCGHLHCVVSRGSVVANGGGALPDIHPPPCSRPSSNSSWNGDVKLG